MFRVFRVLRVDDILEDQKGDQGGGPKKTKIQYGVEPDIFKITRIQDIEAEICRLSVRLSHVRHATSTPGVTCRRNRTAR